MQTLKNFWLGTDASAEQFVEALASYKVALATDGFKAYASTDREDLGLESLLTVQDGVGVVNISGSLVSGKAGYMALFGMTGYEDIRQTLAQAVMNPEVGSIMLHVSSGGGMVDGCEDFCSFLSQVANYKPMTTYADGLMCSAAYWAGSSGQHISTNQTSTVGSLGVVMIHYERSAALAASGVKPTLIRAGKYKMLANSVEPLSEVALSEMQAKADTIYGVFISAVAANRKVTYDVADKQMGQGKEFLGKVALQSGLVDALMTYDQALNYAKSLDKSSMSRNNKLQPIGNMQMKVTLNTAQLAALSAGATTAMLGIDPAAEITNLPVPPAMAAITVDALATLNNDLSAAQASANSLQAALSASQTALATAQAAALLATNTATSATAQVEAMTPLVRDAVTAMSAAISVKLDTTNMTPTELLAKHSELVEPFNKRFPGGRLSVAPSTESSDKPSPATMSYLNLIPSGPKAVK